jgi:hypothetical protein
MLASGIAVGVAIGPATGSGTGAAFAGVTHSLLASAGAGLPGAARQAQPAPATATSSPAPSPQATPTATSVEALAPALPASGSLRTRLLALRAKLRAEREAIERASVPSAAPTESPPATIPSAAGGEELAPTSPSTGAAGGQNPARHPPITNVWVVALSQGSFGQSLGAPAAYPYLDKTLVPEGTLLTGYRVVAHSELANEVALLSGQAPNTATEANCPTYEAVQPQTTSGAGGLAAGTGCVYPASVQTLAGQVTTAGLTWRGYAQDMSSTTAGTVESCVHPVLGEAAPTIAPVAGQDYAAFRNPFVYFDSLLENGACVGDDVDLSQLGPDLGNPASTPNFNWIAPAACDGGSQGTCASAGTSAGTAPVDSFLNEVVAQITATAAFQSHGLIIITFDSAPSAATQSGAAASRKAGADRATETSARDARQAATPTTSGSVVGALLLSPFVHHGSRVSAALNDFSLLKSLEQLYGVPLLGHAADPGVAQLGAKVYTTGAAR